MTEAEQFIDVVRETLGGALRNGPLRVPNHQREYSWKDVRVKKLFDDLNQAVSKSVPYFLGTIVLTQGSPPSVVDGQQRLATTSIFLAAVRDAFLRLGQVEEAKSIEDDFLFKRDRRIRENVPRLTLNTDDREYMMARVLVREGDRKDEPTKRFYSHRLIDGATEIAADRVRTIMANADSDSGKVDALNAWVDFIDNKAVVARLTAKNASRAYQMFKTQNDRVQRTTQADMIKNHLFEHADESRR